MPIYAYRCTQCGLEKEVMQKISDPLLTTCPSCHAETFAKQLTAPGFQLKGSGWYATDFKGGSANKPASTESASTASSAASSPASTTSSATPAAPSTSTPSASS